MGNSIVQVLETVNGASFAGMDTLTNVTLKGGKSNPMQGRVTKAVKGSSVMVFTNKKSNGYENMVKRHLEAEGKDPDSFELGPRAWGTRLPELPLVEHKGEVYLEVIFLKAGEVTYLLDGIPTPKDMIQGLEEKEEGHQGGLSESKKVIIRTYKLPSIKRLRMNGQEYTDLVMEG